LPTPRRRKTVISFIAASSSGSICTIPPRDF